MSITNVAVLFIVCLCLSSICGACGFSGASVIKPLLDVLGLMSVSTTSFLITIMMLCMAFVNLYKNRKKHQVDIRRSVPLGLGAAIGGVVGKQLFLWLRKASGSEDVVLFGQATALGILMVIILIYECRKAYIRSWQIRSSVASASIGLLLGVISGFVGIGGTINLVALHYLFSMDAKESATNSLLIIIFAQIASLISTLVTNSVPDFKVEEFVAVVTAGILGGYLSAGIYKKLSARAIDLLFRGIILCIILVCCINIYNTLMAVL